jgi:hypothetical protein
MASKGRESFNKKIGFMEKQIFLTIKIGTM